jgi:hypothetical protein
MRSEDSLLPLLLVLGLGGVALWLYFRTPTTAKAPDCGLPVSAFGVGTVVPCGVVKGVTTQVKAVVGGVATLPGSIVSTIGDAVTGNLGSHNKCPPGTTDKGWRGCFYADGTRAKAGDVTTPMSSEGVALVTGLGSKVGGEPSSFSAIPPVTAPIPARWSPAK